MWFCNRRQKEKRMTPPNMGGEYNPLTGETDPPHYPDLPGGPHDLNRDFTSPLGHQGSPGNGGDILSRYLSSSGDIYTLVYITMHFNW